MKFFKNLPKTFGVKLPAWLVLPLTIALTLVWSSVLSAQTLQKALQKYAKASSIQFDIHRTDEKVILGTKTEAEGQLKYQKGKLYIQQNSGSKKTELFYSGKTLHLVDHPDADFGPDGRRKITVIKKTIPPLIKSLLNLFSNPKSFNREFAVISQSESEGVYTATLKPKQKNIKNFSLKINTADLALNEMSFTDDVDTKTTLQFRNLQLDKKLNKNVFLFKPLKTDEVLTQ